MSRGIFQHSIGALAGLFACPSCHGALSIERCGAGDEEGFLVCLRCASAVPLIDGFAHFADAAPLAGGPPAAQLEALRAELTGDPQAYAGFADQAWKRPVFEPYAAYAPFNEATRALYPLIETLRSQLAPGDLVVDVWCRTGWTGALLAGLFPQQKVVSLWEGSGGLLGYAGYRYWLGSGARPANWSIAFADPRRGLPFADGAVCLLHAADSLHRFELEPFLRECLRVTGDDGAFVFPHVHLANSEPDPFFERGGSIRHGRDYRQWLDRASARGKRSSFVLSERALFDREDSRTLADEWDTPDYNALIVGLSESRAFFEIGPAKREIGSEDRLILNPLVAVDSVRRRAAFDSGALAGRADYLLKRHPVYAERLAARLPATLGDNELMILYWAQTAPDMTIGQIGARTGLDAAALGEAIRRLEDAEIAHAAPVGGAMARLQHFYSTRRLTSPLRDQHFASLWREMKRRYGSRPLLQADDGSSFGAQDVGEILARMAALLSAKGVGPKQNLVLISSTTTEAVLAIWAAWLLGAAVAPLDVTLPPAQLAEIMVRIKPVLVLAERPYLSAIPGRIARFSLGDTQDDSTLIGAMTAQDPLDLDSLAPPEEGAPAAILFTSGSTGRPKGVILSQGALWRGAQAIVRGLAWNDGDVLLSAGGLHTMSGLRNPCVAALAGGATIVLPDPRHLTHPAALADTIRRFQATLLVTVPAMVALVVAASGQARLRFSPLRQVAVTGSMLSRGLQESGERSFGAPIQVYYGLTETGGVCFLVPGGSARQADGDVGIAAGALGRIAGEAGELQIYSGNLAMGYLDEPERHAALFDGAWLRTGDLAEWGEGGHAILRGRRDDQIKNRFGEIVQPAAIEAALSGCDGVAEAAVLGIGQGADIRIVAFVIPSGAGGAPWLAKLQSDSVKLLGGRQAPDRFVELASLPRLSNGKVAREALRKVGMPGN